MKRVLLILMFGLLPSINPIWAQSHGGQNQQVKQEIQAAASRGDWKQVKRLIDSLPSNKQKAIMTTLYPLAAHYLIDAGQDPHKQRKINQWDKIKRTYAESDYLREMIDSAAFISAR